MRRDILLPMVKHFNININGDNDRSYFYQEPNAILQDGMIIITDENHPKEVYYDPMEYYENPIPVDMVTRILGDDRPERSSFYLHTLFASLDANDPNIILEWIKLFGFLDSIDSISIDHFQELHRNFVIFFTTYSLSITKDSVGIINYFSTEFRGIFNDKEKKHHEMLLDTVNKDNTASSEEKEEVLVLLAHSYLVAFLNEKFYNKVFPNLFLPETDSTNGKRVKSLPIGLAYSAVNLISTLYFMLALDIGRKVIIKSCQNPRCKRFFRASRKSTIFCSEVCKNRVRSQRHRVRRNKS